MTTVHLIRHGEVWNPGKVVYASLEGHSLSRRGRVQAEAAADRLRRRPVTTVISSPLLRARQTARAVAAPHRLAVAEDPRLGEWSGATRWAGHGWDALGELFPEELAQYLGQPDRMGWGESLDVLAARVTAAIEEQVGGAEEAAELVFVSHQDPLQAARLQLTGAPFASFNVDKPLHGEIVTLAPGAPWVEIGRWAPSEQSRFPPAPSR